ncbi:hypothetical protein NMY22_g568 [Coprinellus aureogranulatus]|nr:hypothetical protein NMY22_g568 [Coprinellus aureogranulatus]
MLCPAPSPSHADPALQPSYFTSSLYTAALRQDITDLVEAFHEQYTAKHGSEPPFSTFKRVWRSQRWHLLHFKVFDDRAREKFLHVTCRLFLERAEKQETPFTRVTALLSLYTFYGTQPVGTTPSLWHLKHVPIPIGMRFVYDTFTWPDSASGDQFHDLQRLGTAFGTLALQNLYDPVRHVLQYLQENNVFIFLPNSDLQPQDPRSLPRETWLDHGLISSLAPASQKKKGRPNKNDKMRKAKSTMDALDCWLDRTGPLLNPSIPDSGMSISGTDKVVEYKHYKEQLLDIIRSQDPEGNAAIYDANQLVLQRLKDVRLLFPQEAVSSDGPSGAGFSRIEHAKEDLEHGRNSGGKPYPASPATDERSPSVHEKILAFGEYIKINVRGAPSFILAKIWTDWSAEREAGRQHILILRPRTPFYAHTVLFPRPNARLAQFSLSPDPMTWGSNLSPDHPEPDDYLHNPDPRRDRKNDHGGHMFTYRGLTNLGCMIMLCAGLLALFAGYPLISHFTAEKPSKMGGFNIGGINATGQIPSLLGNYGLIDSETPQDAMIRPSYTNPSQQLQLVFSDEFNSDGRTFYPGDDPYWEAVDLHYWATNNLEWYDPAAVTTKDGFLEVTLSRVDSHDLQYQGGMLSSWNKFCFTGGLLEASVILPGANNVVGLWPAIWSMGNLGRAGYGASLEGMWPYTYDGCDVGTAPNQTLHGQPVQATINGDPAAQGALSYLPGQKLSRCTCPGENHPGPMHKDGTFVGRSAPEIDMFEAQVSEGIGGVSQSAQWAPFNAEYAWFNTSENLIISNVGTTRFNTYTGGAFQQATSCVTQTNQGCYELAEGCSSIYGFEYKPGFDNAYISWISDGALAWTLRSPGMGADSRVEISARPVPQEPMYILINLGMSENFGGVDFDHLTFPATMRVDWIRVYQSGNTINVGCNPKEFPTEDYIKDNLAAYMNPNLTTWTDDYGQPFPKNSYLGQC